MEIKNLATEQRNPKTLHIDKMSTLEMVRTINSEDKKVALAVEDQSEEIAKAIDLGAEKYRQGGRLIYIGAGTSGRLGILDAVELVPTYGILPERAIGLIAGGQNAIYRAVEGAEDDLDLAEHDLNDLELTNKDIVIGLAASGRTPYVIGGLRYAQKIGALTVSVACVKDSKIGEYADVAIEAETGPEVITGSTRMKAGTAQKMILNMISTAIMIKQGKVYENVMIDVIPSNEKLVDRAIRIIMTCTNVNRKDAERYFKDAGKDVGTAIVMAKTHLDFQEAKEILEANQNNVSQVIQKFSN